MKKNVKYLGMAAAALLAVAPVAVTGVANAATITSSVPTGNPGDTDATQISVSMAPTNVANLKSGDSADKVTANLTAKLGNQVVNINLLSGAKAYVFKDGVTPAFNDKGEATNAVKTLEAGQSYYVYAKGVGITGLNPGKTYTLSGITGVNSNGETVTPFGNLGSNDWAVRSSNFTVGQGNAFFVKTGTTEIVTSAEIDFAGNNTISNLVNAITTAVTPKNTNSKIDSTTTYEQLEENIKTALKNADVAVPSSANATIDTPATNFVVNYEAHYANGTTATIPVTVKVVNPAADTKPYFDIKPGVTNVTADGNNFNIKVDKNGADFNIKDYLVAYNNKADKNYTLPMSVSGDINTAVAGVYTLKVSATNPNGKTNTTTVNVTVGDPGKTATVKYVPGYGVNTWSINGNKVTFTGNRVEDGNKVAVFDTASVDGVSYTRVGSKDSNIWIQTQYLDGSYKPSANKGEESVSGVLTVKYDGKGKVGLTNAEGKYTGQYVSKNSRWKVFAKKTINGREFYRIGNQNQWIPAEFSELAD